MIPPYYLLVCLCLSFDILNQFHYNFNFTQFETAKTPQKLMS